MEIFKTRPKFGKAPEGMNGRYREFKWFAWRPVWMRDEQCLTWLRNVVRHENVWGWGFFDTWHTALVRK